MKKRLFSPRCPAAFLALFMMLSTLAACATNTEVPDESEQLTETGVESVTESDLTDSLPDDLNYGGEEIVFISCEEFVFDELTGASVEDVLYERNIEVEDRLDVTFECILESNAIDKVALAVNGGTHEYDIMIDNCWEVAPKFIKNYFYDLRETMYLDFDKIWWNQSFNDVVEYNGAQYGITGAMVLSLYRRTYVTVFNKEIFTDANQPFLYEYVENGTWTIDKQASLVPLLHQDNGNSVQDESGDIYGFITNDFIFVDPYWASCEVEILRKDAGGEYEWVFDSGKLHDVGEKVLNLFYGPGDATYIVTDNNTCESVVLDMFSAGSGAMATLCMHALEDGAMRNMLRSTALFPYRDTARIKLSFTVRCTINLL